MTALLDAFDAAKLLALVLAGCTAGVVVLLAMTARAAQRPVAASTRRAPVRSQPRALPPARPAEAALVVEEQPCQQCGGVMEVATRSGRLVAAECPSCGVVLTASRRGAA